MGAWLENEVREVLHAVDRGRGAGGDSTID